MNCWISVANNTFSRSCYQSIFPSSIKNTENNESLHALQLLTNRLSSVEYPPSSAKLQEIESLSHVNVSFFFIYFVN